MQDENNQEEKVIVEDINSEPAPEVTEELPAAEFQPEPEA